MRIEINLRKTKHGGTSVKHLETEATEIYHGHLHSRVWLKDVGIEVTMDSQDGQWRDEQWARNKAMQALLNGLTPAILKRIISESREAGHHEGVTMQQRLICDALVVS